MARSMLVRSSSLSEEVAAMATRIVDGKPVTYSVFLDLQVVPLPAQFGGADDVAIEHVCLADGYSVPEGGPYTVKYSYRGRFFEKQGLWGDENGQLVAVKP
jgi:hypothetical protein